VETYENKGPIFDKLDSWYKTATLNGHLTSYKDPEVIMWNDFYEDDNIYK
jgi:hypothetical protein